MLRFTTTIVSSLVLTLLLSGCAHQQLRFNTVRQVKTVSNIFEQQVLDNLAMFCADPHSLPFFSLPSTGSSSVSDSIGGDAAAPLNPFFKTLSLEGSRTHGGEWTLETVRDPGKLIRMRCAYQKAVGVEPDCLDCNDLQAKWIDKSGGKYCEIGPGFYCCTSKKLIPNSCTLVGHHCGTYVYVLPEGRDAFTRLVLTILNEAVNDPPAAEELREKTVERRYYNNGLLVRKETFQEPIKPVSDTKETNPMSKRQFNRVMQAYERAKYFRQPAPRQKTPNLLQRLRENELLRRMVR